MVPSVQLNPMLSNASWQTDNRQTSRPICNDAAALPQDKCTLRFGASAKTEVSDTLEKPPWYRPIKRLQYYMQKIKNWLSGLWEGFTGFFKKASDVASGATPEAIYLKTGQQFHKITKQDLHNKLQETCKNHGINVQPELQAYWTDAVMSMLYLTSLTHGPTWLEKAPSVEAFESSRIPLGVIQNLYTATINPEVKGGLEFALFASLFMKEKNIPVISEVTLRNKANGAQTKLTIEQLKTDLKTEHDDWDEARLDQDSKSLMFFLANYQVADQSGWSAITQPVLSKKAKDFLDEKIGTSSVEPLLTQVIAEFQNRPETVPEFVDLLKKHYQNGTGVMTQKQYLGIQKLINQLQLNTNNQTPGGGFDTPKLKERLQFILCDYPWALTQHVVDPIAVRKSLDASHYDMDKIKSRIERYIANEGRKGVKVICLVGPPGVGKTTLSESIANAMGRDFARIPLGSATTESDIKSPDFHYVGSHVKGIAKAISQTRSQNSVILLDEIDKMGQGNGQFGSPITALVDTLDPEQNHHFVDHYLTSELPLDISKHIFIATANTLDEIPEYLRSRMEIIEVDSYDQDEKIEMGKNHVLKKLYDDPIRQQKGITPQTFALSHQAHQAIIDNYARYEAGIREYETKIHQLADEVSLRRSKNIDVPNELNADHVRDMLGPSAMPSDPWHSPRVGSVHALAVIGGTGAVGNKLVSVSSQSLVNSQQPGYLQLADINKNFGEMSDDAVNNAFNFVTSSLKTTLQPFNITLPKGEASIVKVATEQGQKIDGDSGGAATTLGIVSALSHRPVRNDMALTGTITLLGDVGRIGGVAQKLRGAMNAGDGYLSPQGIKTVFLPHANHGDLDFLRDTLKEQLQILDLTAAKPTQTGNFNALIAAETKKAQANRKLLVVLTNRIEPILHYGLQ